jgi:diadenosine tetraphosphatase ApaH/serine/threonine PP2A family protein phosphatase
MSDIHGNINALEAVLHDAGKVERVWCLGDLVGYGPDPNECIKKIRSLKNCICLMGNHDSAVLGNMDMEAFNRDARLSVEWNQRIIKPENMNFLKHLPEKHVEDRVTLVHGSPRNPVWEYILDWQVAMNNFDYFETDLCFVGHTHIPVIFQMIEEELGSQLQILSPVGPVELIGKAIVNPGSVGQPRDRDPRAAYALFDTESKIWEPRRIAYNVVEVQERITKNGLPERNAVRLSDGW